MSASIPLPVTKGMKSSEFLLMLITLLVTVGNSVWSWGMEPTTIWQMVAGSAGYAGARGLAKVGGGS